VHSGPISWIPKIPWIRVPPFRRGAPRQARVLELEELLLELLLDELELLEPVGSSSQPARPATPKTAAPESISRKSRRVGAECAVGGVGGS